MNRYFDAIFVSNTKGGLYVRGRRYLQKTGSYKQILYNVPR